MRNNFQFDIEFMVAELVTRTNSYAEGSLVD